MGPLRVFLFFVTIKYSLGYSDVKVVLYENEGTVPGVHKADECESILFNSNKAITCACVTGVWAFYDSICTSPQYIVGGNNYCFKIQDKTVGKVALISSPNSTYESSLTWLSEDSGQIAVKVTKSSKVKWNLKDSTIVTTGEFSWSLYTNTGEVYCLSHLNPKTYCQYNGLGPYKVLRVQQHCDASENFIEPTSCQEYFDANDEYEVCNTEMSEDEDLTKAKVTIFKPKDLMGFDEFQSLVEPMITLSRRKRQGADPPPPDPGAGGAPAPPPGGAPAPSPGGAPAPAPAGAPAAAASNATGGNSTASPEIEDEDYIDPEQLTVVNNPLIVEQLKTNLDALIASATGGDTYGITLKIPILKVLDKCVSVMAKTCGVLEESYFKAAFSTFINIQRQTLHFKEPYITQTQFTRIQTALASCEAEAKKHNFQKEMPGNGTNSTAPQPAPECDVNTPPNATNVLMKNNIFYNLTVEPDKSGLLFEPIIETVWKIFLNAHSYCYKYFSDYYNDHHTFAVTLLPLFTNEIQNIWMNSTLNGTYVEPKEPLLIYGGLIGDHRVLMKNIDLCVAASRVGSAYPWLMNRPPRDETNKWVRRKKRSVEPTDEICLKDVDDANKMSRVMGCNR